MLCGAKTDGENNWKHYKIAVFSGAGIPNHNLHHPITPTNNIEVVFENRWNISTKSMTIDFYDKQPLCVINSRIKKISRINQLFPIRPLRVLSIGLGRYVPASDELGWLGRAWLWGYLCYVHWAELSDSQSV